MSGIRIKKNRSGVTGTVFKGVDVTCLDLLADLGGNAEVLLDGGENLVAAGAGFFNVTGLQGESQAFGR